MKKNKILLIQVFILGVMLSGCGEPFIDLTPRDQMTMDVALQSLENLEGNILSVYERARQPYSGIDHSLYKCFYTDIIKPGGHILDQPNWNSLCTFDGFDARHPSVREIWENYYYGLNRANIIVDKIDVVEYNKKNPEAVQRRNTVLGEALFFRAFFHLNLIEYWDNIVLADRVFDDPNAEYSLAGKSDVYDLIVSDLEEAIGLLPDASKVISRGKVSKGVARHLLSLAHLDLGNWADAAALAEEVIADPAYSFYAPIAGIFSELNQENSEIVFAFQFIPGGTYNWTACMMAPLYDRNNGVDRTFEQGARPWARNVPSDYYFSLFEEDDLRLEAWHKRYWIYDIDSPEDPLPGDTVYTPGDPVIDTVIKDYVINGNTVPKTYYLWAHIGDTVTVENMINTAGLGAESIEPVATKYWEGNGLDREINDAASYKNIIVFRISEAYLVAAEGYLRSATNMARGQELFDELRARAGVASIELNESNLLDEHARELGLEGRRYPMLKRLDILLDRVKTYSPEVGNNMQPFHVRWPIPKNFVDLTGVPQNEGY